MSDPNTKVQSWASKWPSEEFSPAEIARRAVTLTDGHAALRAGDSPIWRRLDSPRKCWWSRLWWFLAWCVTLTLLGVAIARVGYHDGTILLTWLNAFTWYVYLPNYVVLALAVWKQRWALATASAAVAAMHVAWVLPDFRPPTPYRVSCQSAVQASPELRVYYANVWAQNSNHEAIIEEIAKTDPDVIVLVEFLPHLASALRASPVMNPYIYGTNLDGQYAGEIAVLSKRPVRRQQVTYVAGELVNIADIELGQQTLRLLSLHGPRPLLDVPAQYTTFWAKAEPLIVAQDEPLLVLGDFNATQNSAVLARLTSGRLRSAHVDRGRGYATTWPNGQWPLPPIRIDHALLSPQVECLGITEGTGGGSDHKALILDIRLHGVPSTNRVEPDP